MKVDLALVGGGLANSLIGYRMRRDRPHLELLIIERGPDLGGNHTWSFHDSDVSPAQRAWLEPLVEASWPCHELRFPKRRRVMQGGYNSVSSARLREVVGPALAKHSLCGTEVVEVDARRVRLADGTSVEAEAVIDGRGDPGARHLEVAFQKFLGLFVRLEHDHGLAGPILMDATVPQIDGYRFVYTLPFSERDLLIEDTYYSDGPALDREPARAAILAYAEAQGWRVAEVLGDEYGVLPIVLGGDIGAFWEQGAPGVPRSGMRGAFFHPTTGYSLPEAAALADDITALPRIASEPLYHWTRRRSEDLWRRCAYFRLLNRMLFRAAEPDLRYRIFERFYGLSDDLIQRFYAGRLRFTDKLRILTGRPPVPLRRALKTLLAGGRSDRHRSSSAAGEAT